MTLDATPNPLFKTAEPTKAAAGRKKKAPPLPDTPALAIGENVVLAEGRVKAVKIEDAISGNAVLTRPKRSAKREIRELRAKQSAAEAVAGLAQDNEIYGFTKGQFTLLELWQAVLGVTGPAFVTISTWTAARNEIRVIENLLIEHRLTGARWLIDATFGRRDPEACAYIKKTFGADCMRIANTHTKFAVFTNDRWKVVLRTSMNLNMNPRFEDFTIAHDPELADFITDLMDKIWAKQKASLADATATEKDRYFREEM